MGEGNVVVVCDICFCVFRCDSLGTKELCVYDEDGDDSVRVVVEPETDFVEPVRQGARVHENAGVA